MPYFATKIKMNYGRWSSQYPEDIDKIYVQTCGWIEKEDLHDYLKKYPRSVVVNLPPYPPLIPAISRQREKYVRSNPDIYKHDDLMDLPKE